MIYPQYVVAEATKTAIEAAIPQIETLLAAITVEQLSPGSHLQDAADHSENLRRVLTFLKPNLHYTDIDGVITPPIVKSYNEGAI